MSHLKRIRAPRNWPIKRKRNKFTTRPNPGPHNMENAVSLNFLLRDMLGITKTTKETKKVLQEGKITVNGIIRKDHKFLVGILDILSIQISNENYILLFSKSNKIQPVKIKENFQGKISQIINKTMLRGKKLQLNLSDGNNVIVNKDSYKVGDSLIIEKNKIKKHLKLEKGSHIYLIGGQHKGSEGIIEGIKSIGAMQQDRVIIKTKEGKLETLKKYAVAIEKPFTK